MQTASQRRELIKREEKEFAGRQDFPESLTMPKSKDNNVALYGVSWANKKGNKTGNWWRDKAKAEEVARAKLSEGTFLYTYTAYCSGFAAF